MRAFRYPGARYTGFRSIHFIVTLAGPKNTVPGTLLNRGSLYSGTPIL